MAKLSASSPRYVPLSAVTLGPGWFADAEQRNLEAVLRLDPDRLTAPFLIEAGLDPAKPGYSGWEGDGLNGHTAGHVLSALATSVAGTGDPRAQQMLDAMLENLRAAQVAVGTGYVGGVPNGIALWEEISEGKIDSSAFDLNGRWVPLYNLHKVLAGLVDVATYAPSEVGTEVLEKFGRWWLETFEALSDQEVEEILLAEFGGLTDTFARLAAITGERGYLDLAMRFASKPLLEPLLSETDDLDGRHANTRIPVVLGYATIARVARDMGIADENSERFLLAATRFFDQVLNTRTTAIGGNSVSEAFTPKDDLGTMFLAKEGPESCNTYNMMALASELYLLTGESGYLEYVENARVNHALSAIHPEHGSAVYFTTHRPGHYRVYAPEADGFWCCMGSGFQAHARHGAEVFLMDEGTLQILQPISAELHLPERGLDVKVVSSFPAGDVVNVSVETGTPIDIEVRIPVWSQGTSVTVSGEVTEVSQTKQWWEGTVSPGNAEIRLVFTREATVASAPDGSHWGWVRRGPLVLAQELPDPDLEYRVDGSRVAHIAAGPLLPIAGTPVIDPDDLEATGLEDGGARVRTADGQRIDLQPFATLHDARYRLSWPLADDKHYRERLEELQNLDLASTALEARIIDGVRFGEQQPESDHGVHSPGSTAGITNGVAWRESSDPIRLRLTDWKRDGETVRVEWLDEEVPAPFTIEAEGRTFRVDPAEGEKTERGIAYEAFELGARTSSEDLEVVIRPEGKMTPRLRRLLILRRTGDGV